MSRSLTPKKSCCGKPPHRRCKRCPVVLLARTGLPAAGDVIPIDADEHRWLRKASKARAKLARLRRRLDELDHAPGKAAGQVKKSGKKPKGRKARRRELEKRMTKAARKLARAERKLARSKLGRPTPRRIAASGTAA